MAKLVINENKKVSHINAEIYGHFSEHLGRCIYEGLYVGEDSDIPNVNGMRSDVVNALKNLNIPVLRWPGGCFADEYHWMDGVGPKEDRKKMINTHWGGVLEDNSFGTHEFMELCEQIGAKAYINGNLGSGTVREMSEWIEYMTFDGVSPMADLRRKNGREKPWKVDFFGVGNENWGCGGNMTPEYYANEYRRYQTYIRNYDSENPIFKICCGTDGEDREWTDKVCATCFDKKEQFHGYMDGLSLHYYVLPTGDWDGKGSSTDFDKKAWYETLKKALHMEDLIIAHGTIMDKYDPNKKVGMIVDEWGAWYDVEPGTNPGFLYQQNTMRDALIAGITLNIFNKHSDRVRMANIAQIANVLQSVVLTEGEKMILTPTYHVFDMYKYHQDSELLQSSIETSTIGIDDSKVVDMNESVSIDKDGNINITVTNLSADEKRDVEVLFAELNPTNVKANVVTGDMKAHNTFDEPNNVHIEDMPVTLTERGLKFSLPACSVCHVKVK